MGLGIWGWEYGTEYTAWEPRAFGQDSRAVDRGAISIIACTLLILSLPPVELAPCLRQNGLPSFGRTGKTGLKLSHISHFAQPDSLTQFSYPDYTTTTGTISLAGSELEESRDYCGSRRRFSSRLFAFCWHTNDVATEHRKLPTEPTRRDGWTDARLVKIFRRRALSPAG